MTAEAARPVGVAGAIVSAGAGAGLRHQCRCCAWLTVARVKPEMIAIARSIRCSFIMPPFSGHAPKRNGHIVHIMDKRSWRQAGAVIVVRDPGKEALANVWKLGLDARKVKEQDRKSTRLNSSH